MDRSEQEELVRRALGVSDYVVDRGRAMRVRLFLATWPTKDLEADAKFLQTADSVLNSLSQFPEDFLDGVLGGWETIDDTAARLRNKATPITNTEAAFETAKVMLRQVVDYAAQHPRKDAT